MNQKGVKNFDDALYSVGEKIRRILLFVSDEIKERTQEIRIRAGKPLCLTLDGQTVFVGRDSSVTDSIDSAYKVSPKELEEVFKNLTQSSVYSHIRELKEGYIMMKNGCRAGVAGTFSESGGITDISSVNIRIAREVLGVALPLFSAYKEGGVLICGGAASGKTTLLRDFVRLLSNSGKRIAVVDSRGELSASANSQCLTDLGFCTDVLLGFEKEKGFETALRTLYPFAVAFDEISSIEQVEKIKESLYSGTNIITSAHLGSISELKKRAVTAALMESGAISIVVMMGKKAGEPYRVFTFLEAEEICGG